MKLTNYERETLDKIMAMENHARVRSSFVIGVEEGVPVKIAHILTIRSKEFATLRMGVRSWSEDQQGNNRFSYDYRIAKGSGYDKLAACLEGTMIGGYKIGTPEAPTIEKLCERMGWLLLLG